VVGSSRWENGTKYTPGTFSWTDLTTTDQPAAKAFYSALFGWSAIDNPVGDGVYYSMMQLDGKDVAAISPQMQGQRDAGAPPTWNSYITVESADETLERATQLGGTVHAPAFNVMDVGRMGTVQDPQGAFFLAWEPKSHIGASLVNGPGLLSWNELATPDLEASAGFYSELLGWKVTPFEGMQFPYMTIETRDGHGNGGMRATMENEPPYWLVYFGSDDVGASLARANELGGTTMVGKTSIGVGEIGVLQDPQGAMVALYGGQFAD
jgi:predicted enzyme related to lactoylglutathione lyase